MNLDVLNKMIEYIEDNLDAEHDVDLKKLSIITNTNLFILERVFMFLTSMTIIEYIKKRRLSKAFEEIRNTDKKIIDIAFKYQYNSAPAFNRAFKQLFHITPTECRKGEGSYQIIPREYFRVDTKKYDLNYQIKEIDSIHIYCYHITAKAHSTFLYMVKKLYEKVKCSEYYKKFNEVGMYGIFEKKNNEYNYYLGSTWNFPNAEKYTIQKQKYVFFKPISREQNDIVNLSEAINEQWIPSVGYTAKNSMKIEYYKDAYCYIFLPIEFS